MADVIKGKVWALDTVAGLVTNDPVCIFAIRVRWTTAAAGSCQISTANSDDLILNVETTAASTAVVWDLTRTYLMGNQTFSGLTKVLSVSVDTIEVVTGIPIK